MTEGIFFVGFSDEYVLYAINIHVTYNEKNKSEMREIFLSFLKVYEVI
jgi:hypothetical protein